MLALYLDEDSMDQSIVAALRARWVDVITATEAGMLGRSDSEQLDYVTGQGRVLFTFNRGDFYRLHTQYLTEGKSHRGIILASQQRYSIGEQLRQILDLISVKTIEQMENNVEFIKG